MFLDALEENKWNMYNTAAFLRQKGENKSGHFKNV